MKKQSITITTIIVIFIFVGLSSFLFQTKQEISKNIHANVYVNGEIVNQTMISISGVQRKSLAHGRMDFVGTFSIDCYEKSVREETEAKITWLNQDTQYISFYYKGNFTELDIKDISIDEKMDNVLIKFLDGTIVASPNIPKNEILS